MTVFIVIIHVIVCIGLILIVLLQTGKGASMGAAFGGSSQTIFRKFRGHDLLGAYNHGGGGGIHAHLPDTGLHLRPPHQILGGGFLLGPRGEISPGGADERARPPLRPLRRPRQRRPANR